MHFPKTLMTQPTTTADQAFDPSQPTACPADTLIIGCGNLLRGDDAIGPVLIRRMWDRGLPPGVLCADGGTGGMDVAFQMRGVGHVILVDACQSGSKPGELFELPGDEVEQLPPVEGVNLHAFRWDHALAFARWLLKDDYPERVTVYLIEGEQFGVGEPLSAAVEPAVDRLVERLLTVLSADAPPDTQIELTESGYLRLTRELSERWFPADTLLAMAREDELLLLPTRGAAAGGLVLKQRNAQGDRSLLLAEVFNFDLPVGRFSGQWDDAIGGLRVPLSAASGPQAAGPQAAENG